MQLLPALRGNWRSVAHTSRTRHGEHLTAGCCPSRRNSAVDAGRRAEPHGIVNTRGQTWPDGKDGRAGVQSHHGAHRQNQEVARDGKKERLTVPRASQRRKLVTGPAIRFRPEPATHRRAVRARRGASGERRSCGAGTATMLAPDVLALGAARYIEKGVDPDTIAAMIEEVATAPPAVVQA